MNPPTLGREHYLELLNEITQAAIGTLDLNDMLQTLADRLGELFMADACHIALWDEARQIPIPAAASGTAREAFLSLQVKPGQQTLTAALLKLGRVLAVPDVANTIYIDPEIVAKFPQKRSFLGLPFIASGQGLGAAILGFDRPRQFTDQEIVWGEQTAAQIALAIARARLLETEREQRELAETLREVTAALNATLDFDELLDRLLLLIARVVPYDSAAFMLVEAGVARVVRQRGFDKFGESAAHAITEVALDVATTVNLRIMAANGRPLIIPDVTQYDGWVQIPPFQHIASWAGAPVMVQAELFGIFTLDKQEPGFYHPQYAEPLTAFAEQSALAISNARLHAAMQRQLQELTILHAVTLAGATALSEDELIERATTIIGDALYPDNFGFLIYDERIHALRPHPSYRPLDALIGYATVPLTMGITGQVFRSARPYRVGDVRQEPNYIEVDPHTRSELCVPLQTHGRIIGVINTESKHLHAFTAADERLLTTLAGQLATAIERIRLFAAERLRRQEADTLREAIAAVTSSLKLEQVLDTILEQLNRVVPYDSAAVLLLEADKMQLVAGRGFPEDVQSQLLGKYLPVSNSLAEKLRQDKRPIVLEDAQADSRFQSWGGATYIHGWMGLPLLARDSVIGFLTVDKRQIGAYQEWDALLAQAFAHQAAAAIEHARLYGTAQQAQQLAHRQAEELRVTADILSLLNATPIVTEAFAQIAATLKQLTGCAWVTIFLFDTDDQEKGTLFTLAQQPDGAADVTLYHLPIHSTAAADDILAGRPHLTPDLQQEMAYPGDALLYQTGFRSRLNIPLIGTQRIVGAINCAWHQSHGYNQEQLPLLLQIGSAIALAVERSRLFDETNRRTAELELLTNFSSHLRQAVFADSMLPVIVETICQVADVFFVSLLLVEPESDELVVRSEFPLRSDRPARRLKLNQGISGYVARTGKMYITHDFSHDPHVHVLPEEQENFQRIGSSVTLPLRTQEHVIGVIHITFPKETIVSDATLRLLIAIAEIAGSALDRALVLENLEQHVAERTHALAKANIRLQELDRLKSKFVSDVSHELRTPITNLKLYLDLMERGRADRQAYYMSVLRQQTIRLTDLFEDILSLSRLEMGAAKVKLLPVDLNKVVEQVMAANLPRFELTDLTIDYTLQSDLPLVQGERNQLAQVVTNLLTNAIRYTPAGSIALQTAWDEDKGMALLRVTDTGIGIHPDDYDYLFDRFYRGQHTGQSNIPGTGLGLAIVKEIVDLHGGEIHVQSVLGEGTTFIVELPGAGDQ